VSLKEAWQRRRKLSLSQELYKPTTNHTALEQRGNILDWQRWLHHQVISCKWWWPAFCLVECGLLKDSLAEMIVILFIVDQGKK
jgi:hypothetical protein